MTAGNGGGDNSAAVGIVAQDNALHLPEIRYLIGSFLSWQDLTSCTMVSRAWKESFTPLVWRHTLIKSPSTLFDTPPPLSVLRANARYMRSLRFDGFISPGYLDFDDRDSYRRRKHEQKERTRIKMEKAEKKKEEARKRKEEAASRKAERVAEWLAVKARRKIESEQSRTRRRTERKEREARAWEGGNEPSRYRYVDFGNGDGIYFDPRQAMDRYWGNDDDNDSYNSYDSDEYIYSESDIEDEEDDDEEQEEEEGEEDESDFEEDVDYDPKIDHHRLEFLYISGNMQTAPSRLDMWASYAGIVHRNQSTLRAIHIALVTPAPSPVPSPTFWRAVTNCSTRLTTLQISGREILMSSLQILWKGCHRHLTRLTIENCLVDEQQYDPLMPMVGSSTLPPPLPKKTFSSTPALMLSTSSTSSSCLAANGEAQDECTIRHLKLKDLRGIHPIDQFRLLIASCPQLETLEWHIHQGHCLQIQETFAPPASPWKGMQRLEIVDSARTCIMDEQLEQILSFCKDPVDPYMDRLLDNNSTRYASSAGSSSISKDKDKDTSIVPIEVDSKLKTIDLRSTAFGPKAFPTLVAYLPGITYLDLSLCRQVTSPMIQQILESSPNLLHIHANTLNVQDISQGQPWVCTQLQTWAIYIDFPSPYVTKPNLTPSQYDKDLEHFHQLHLCFYTQLATLTKLETLDLDHRFPLPPRGTLILSAPLRWSLARGLARLEPLSNLRTLQLTTHQAMLGLEWKEATWMVNHWDSLETVKGRMGKKRKEAKELTRIFLDRGIVARG